MRTGKKTFWPARVNCYKNSAQTAIQWQRGNIFETNTDEPILLQRV
jgi:hypothetical protein